MRQKTVGEDTPLCLKPQQGTFFAQDEKNAQMCEIVRRTEAILIQARVIYIKDPIEVLHPVERVYPIKIDEVIVGAAISFSFNGVERNQIEIFGLCTDSITGRIRRIQYCKDIESFLVTTMHQNQMQTMLVPAVAEAKLACKVINAKIDPLNISAAKAGIKDGNFYLETEAGKYKRIVKVIKTSKEIYLLCSDGSKQIIETKDINFIQIKEKILSLMKNTITYFQKREKHGLLKWLQEVEGNNFEK